MIKNRNPHHLLLVVILLFICALPWFDPLAISGEIVTISGLILVLSAGLNVLRHNRLLFHYGLGISILFVVISIVLQFYSLPILSACSFSLFFILLLTVLVNIILMLVHSNDIEPSFLSGSVAGYLMIAICLAYFLTVIAIFDQEQMLTQPNASMGFNDYLYFSLITMTTIGYGDISPVEPIVRTATVLTGVFGQFYMAVVVAIIVGKLMGNAQERKNP